MGQRDPSEIIVGNVLKEIDTMHVVRISVRNLVEFILRSGDITTSSSGLRDPEAMQEGTRIHQKLQRRMGSNYRSEVTLSMDIPVTVRDADVSIEIPGGPEPVKATDSKTSKTIEATMATKTIHDTDTSEIAEAFDINHPDSLHFLITLEGRADGIFSEETGTVIDEIKGVYQDIFSMKEPVPVHLAQALCYAYIYAQQESLDGIGVRMTYCHIPTEKVRYFTEYRTFPDLEKWFFALIKEYAKWCTWQIQWQKKRNASIKETDFPFSYRPGQAKLVKGVYQSILRKKRLYIEAPTGVGKTISTVFPAVKSIGEEVSEKIFYLTAKTITRTVAEDTFSLLEKNGTALKFITLTAKEKICILEKPACNPDTCERAKGHFDRINNAVFDVLAHETSISRDCIANYAKKHQVCPFEFSLDLSIWADAVICDYNYVFDPIACLKRFFAAETENDFIFLVDEAHNLVDRAREMYSAVLVKEQFLAIKKVIEMKSKKTASALGACNRAMLELKKLCDTVTTYKTVQIDTLLLRLIRLHTLLEELLQSTEEISSFSGNDREILSASLSPEEREQLLDFYFIIREFLNIYELLDEHYIIYGDYDDNGNFRLHLQCMDPSANLDTYLKKSRCSVFFSATLLPIHYYREQLGCRKDDYAIYAPSPFSADNRLLMIGKGVSTKYTRRSPEMYQKIAEYILKFAAGKTGNYLVFFPSYQMLYTIKEYLMEQMENALPGDIPNAQQAEDMPESQNPPANDNFMEKNSMIDLYIQSSSMTEEEREEFLSHFTDNPSKTAVGLCVMGGIFSEGIDLKKERLIGAVLVGTGLPMVCAENELLKNYFNEKKKEGFSYAYQFPGMNKVLQAAGRVIRTTEDKGAVLLLDDRFLQSSYQKLFPREWFPHDVVTLASLSEKLSRFWNR